MSDGEFHFTLTEKVDRDENMYLFAGVKILNAVLFIRPRPEEPGQPRKWDAVLKPYRPRDPKDPDAAAWADDTNQSQERPNDQRIAGTETRRRPGR